MVRGSAVGEGSLGFFLPLVVRMAWWKNGLLVFWHSVSYGYILDEAQPHPRMRKKERATP
jgi:hypothetical protein